LTWSGVPVAIAELPETNRDNSVWTITLVILAGITAAASISFRVRGAKRA
jgi:LPXTG-motif cell wall-anchored protein